MISSRIRIQALRVRFPLEEVSGKWCDEVSDDGIIRIGVRNLDKAIGKYALIELAVSGCRFGLLGTWFLHIGPVK